MESGENTGDALPLAEAAARLGLSRDALRMRLRRGKARGFKRGGQLYVWLDDAALAAAPRSGPARETGAAPPAAAPESGPWPALAALQKEEIARLIRETERLNLRLDRHLDEMREMRQMLQREQVLRQQEQALRRDVQSLLERLIAHPSLAVPLASAALPVSPPRRETGPGTAARQDGDGSLGEMLKQIGRSLRDLETRRASEDSAARDAPQEP